MKKTTQNQHDAVASTTVRQPSAGKRKCKREERIGARDLVKAQDPDSQNDQRSVENDRNEKNYSLSRKRAIRSASGP
jgi:hypothetical protein